MPPQLATLTSDAPDGDDWIHEIKYDGYRLLAWIDGDRVRLLTRNRKDWTDRFPEVAEAPAGLGVRDSVWDGELTVELESGATSFQALQNAMRDRSRGTLRFFLFDVLRHSGSDVRGRPLLERKEDLRTALGGSSGVLRYSDHIRGRGPAFLAEVCSHQLEGIISKRAAAPYRGGRGRDWLKVKCVRDQEFVIGGFTEPGGSRVGLGALHVGAWEGDRLIYRGKVGTGFTDAVLRDLRSRLERLEREVSPFTGGPTGAAGRAARWVEPALVAQVRFTDITDDGRLDPDEGMEWDGIVEAAGHVRDLLDELGLVSFVKTTGGKGLHVVVPLVRRADWEEVRLFSKAVASLLAEAAPDRYTLDVSRKKREGRILLDYLRNSRGATAIEAYSTRARPGAPVATPIAWDELHDGVRSDSFTVKNLPARLRDLTEDPWSEMGTVRQSLTAPMKRRVGM